MKILTIIAVIIAFLIWPVPTAVFGGIYLILDILIKLINRHKARQAGRLAPTYSTDGGEGSPINSGANLGNYTPLLGPVSGINYPQKSTARLPQGEPLAVADKIFKAPHVLIGGTTGSGKSVFLNGLLYSLMTTTAPSMAQLILIDPKRVELRPYKDTAYCVGYTNNSEEAVTLLESVIEIIDDRYSLLEIEGERTWQGSQLYIVFDEFADLMISEQGKQIKKQIQKILQIGRASGVHIIACTQSPSRKTIPAELTLNFTDRIALHCMQAIESRQLINQPGAELLPRHGKAIYLSPAGIETINIPVTPEEEINRVIDYWIENK